jgi:acetyl-CoA carboxylase carboxyl transferase subunit beta
MGFLKRSRFVSVVGRKSGVPDGLWLKCPGCSQAVYRADVQENLNTCPHCDHHYRIAARDRIDSLVDPESFRETHADLLPADPLDFNIEEVSYSYRDKLKSYREKSGLNEAIVTGEAHIEETPAILSVMDFTFCGASMGSVVGEKFFRACEEAARERIPLVSIATSGGARMQEGILGLMQMAKTSEAVRVVNEAAVPYISVLTNPTTGGVYASFASLGDIILAEPGAEIGFAGKRLIEGALRVKLPEGFQSAEYQFDNGFVDRIVKRAELRPVLGKLLRYLSPRECSALPQES